MMRMNIVRISLSLGMWLCVATPHSLTAEP